MVTQADSTLQAIKTKVRRLTASSSTSALSESDLENYINTFYSQDFPYAIKLDQMRSVYTFYTSPNIDRYPLDINYNQGIRDPVYFEGVQGYFFKDRNSFYNMWPRWPTKFTPISGDGVTTAFTFTISGTPFLRNEVVIGGTDSAGGTIQVSDDGNGNLQSNTPNAVTTNPPYTGSPPIPGMHNQNVGNPGLNTKTNIGTVDYVTGAFSITFPVAPASGTQVTVWVSQYQTGRPYTLLFWNNEFQIRPVPDNVYKVEVETYLTPVQFLANSDNPIINQWWQYIAIGAAIKVLEDRQDMEGIQNLIPLFDRQEALVLERQGVEEIGQRNTTIFTQVIQNQSFGTPYGWY